MFIQEAGNHSPADTLSQPRRPQANKAKVLANILILQTQKDKPVSKVHDSD
jgi:hypothetical protein